MLLSYFLIGCLIMPITVDQVQNIFNNIDKGENEKFFHV